MTINLVIALLIAVVVIIKVCFYNWKSKESRDLHTAYALIIIVLVVAGYLVTKL